MSYCLCILLCLNVLFGVVGVIVWPQREDDVFFSCWMRHWLGCFKSLDFHHLLMHPSRILFCFDGLWQFCHFVDDFELEMSQVSQCLRWTFLTWGHRHPSNMELISMHPSNFHLSPSSLYHFMQLAHIFLDILLTFFAYSLETSTSRHWYFQQSHVNLKFFRQRHFWTCCGRSFQTCFLQQEIHHLVPRNSNCRQVDPAWWVGQTCRLGRNKGCYQYVIVHLRRLTCRILFFVEIDAGFGLFMRRGQELKYGIWGWFFVYIVSVGVGLTWQDLGVCSVIVLQVYYLCLAGQLQSLINFEVTLFKVRFFYLSSSVVSSNSPSSEVSSSSSSLNSIPELHLEQRFWNLSHQVRTSSRQYDKTFSTNLTAPVRKDRLPSILDPLIDHVHRSSRLFWPMLFVLEDWVWFPEFGWTVAEWFE